MLRRPPRWPVITGCRSEAVARFVTDGSQIAIGGFTINRNPMAAVREIIRQGRRNLHLVAHSNGQGLDELVGAGCVARAEIRDVEGEVVAILRADWQVGLQTPTPANPLPETGKSG